MLSPSGLCLLFLFCNGKKLSEIKWVKTLGELCGESFHFSEAGVLIFSGDYVRKVFGL